MQLLRIFFLSRALKNWCASQVFFRRIASFFLMRRNFCCDACEFSLLRIRIFEPVCSGVFMKKNLNFFVQSALFRIFAAEKPPCRLASAAGSPVVTY